MPTSPRAERPTQPRRWLWPVALLAALAAAVAAPPAPAQEGGKALASLDLVPADVMYYSVMLRNKEQLDAVLNSKAWARLMDLPAVQMARGGIEGFWNFPFGPAAQIKGFIEQPENQQLLALLGEMFADEVFSYGGKNAADFLTLMGELSGASQFAPLMAILQGGDPQAANDPTVRARAVLEALNDNVDRLKAPDIILGFRLKDTKTAKAQLKRLHDAVQAVLRLNPQHEGRWFKSKTAGGDFYNLKLDGGMVPWDMLPWERIEENQGQFDNLKKKLRDLKLMVSIGLRDNFVVVSLSDTPKLLEGLGGKGPRLASRDELKPLAKFADRRITSIAYASKEWNALQSTGDPKDIEQMIQGALDFLQKSDLDEKQKAKIQRDLKELGKDLAKYTTEPAPSLSFEFLTETGSESYSYDWTKDHGYETGKPLTILRHAGGAPLLFIGDRTKHDAESYEVLVKWLKVAWGYVEEFGVARLPEEQKEKYDAFMKDARPLLGRLHETTGKMLVPALADGQGALVLDAKLTSKQWHRDMPEAQKPLPLLEPALVLGVKDADLLKKALKEYRQIANELIALAGKFSPEGQAKFQIPEAQTKESKGATLYSYPAPEESGFDKQIAPTAGVSKSLFVLTLSQEHAERLLRPTPLKAPGKLLADAKRPLAGAAHVDCAGFLDAIGAWVEYGLRTHNVGEVGALDVPTHVRTVLEVLKTFRSYCSITYAEDGALVTHGESVIRDID